MHQDKSNRLTNSPNGTGERAAMGGYTHQYDEFARRVYDCILDGSLESIRVADAEENVGKLDDICYVTGTEVHGYQVKWSNIDNTFKYKDFKELLPEIVDGWRKLKSLYADKIIVPHLLTNRKYCNNDRSLRNKSCQIIGSFSQYKHEVLDKLKEGKKVNSKWADALTELNTFSTLTDEENRLFWNVFELNCFDEQAEIDVHRRKGDKRTEDLLDVARLIQIMASSRNREVLATRDDIIRKLNCMLLTNCL